MTQNPIQRALDALNRGNQARAQTILRQTIAAAPDDADAANLAGMLRVEPNDERRLPASLLRSLAIAPAEPEFLHNLGLASLRLDRLAAAAAALRRSLALQPSLTESLIDLGTHSARHGDYDAAARFYARAVSREPERMAAHQNLGWSLLAQGDLRTGFREYAWRWRDPRFVALRTSLAGRPWDGRPFAGTLLVFAEQGLGDTLQFCRLAWRARDASSRVVLEVQPELSTLLRRSLDGIEVTPRASDFPRSGRPPHDRHAALLDLPALLGLDLAQLPAAPIPYLRPDPEKQRRWQERLAAHARGRPSVGLVWAGNPRADDPAAAEVDRRRSIPASSLRALSGLTHLCFVSLQTGRAAADLGATEIPMLDISAELTDFDETAAVASALDVIVSVDTAVAHLAGGLARPTWVLSRADGCWRWLMHRDDSPWYPTVRLFRQDKPNDWSTTLTTLSAALGAQWQP